MLHAFAECAGLIDRVRVDVARQRERPGEARVSVGEVRIEVEDSGVGISEEELPHIYDKFFRSANPTVQAITGTGLGLSMAFEVIKLHGGDMTVQSKLGEGTTFVATLPLE